MRLRLLASGSRPWERWIRRWGISFLVDDDILFDAFGDGHVLMHNMRRFKVDTGAIRQVAVSHEHWDHVDGLRLFLGKRPGVKVFVPQHADGKVKNRIRDWGGDVVDNIRPVRLKEGVYLSAETIGRYKDKGIPEQALVLETVKGLVIVAGCAHPGIMKIVSRVKKDFRKPVYAVIGGFHLKNRSMEDISIKAARIKAAGITKVFPLHCTGARAERVFEQAFGAGCCLLREGQEIKF